MSDKSHDQESRNLADYFLSDYTSVSEAERMELAQLIQDTVEDWLAVFDEKHDDQ